MERDNRAWWKPTTKTWRTCSAPVYSAPWCSYGIAKVGETVCVWPSSASASAVWTTVKWTSDGARLKFFVFAYWDSVVLGTTSAVTGFWQKKRQVFRRLLDLFFSRRNLPMILTPRELYSTMCGLTAWIKCEKIIPRCIECEIKQLLFELVTNCLIDLYFFIWN